MKTRVSNIVLAAIGLSALFAKAQADPVTSSTLFDWSYTGDGVIASGTLTTDGVVRNNIGGLGLTGEIATSITGTRNGVDILSLLTGPIPGQAFLFGSIPLDNGIISGSVLGLDWNGLGYVAGNSIRNIATLGWPNGGGGVEYGFDLTGIWNGVNGIPVDFKIAPAVVSTPPTSGPTTNNVPDRGNTLVLLAITITVLVTGRSILDRFHRKNVPTPGQAAYAG